MRKLFVYFPKFLICLVLVFSFFTVPIFAYENATDSNDLKNNLTDMQLSYLNQNYKTLLVSNNAIFTVSTPMSTDLVIFQNITKFENNLISCERMLVISYDGTVRDRGFQNDFNISRSSYVAYYINFSAIQFDKLTDLFFANVTLNALPSDGGKVSGGGKYEFGSTVTLDAFPNWEYQFVEWSDGSRDNPRIITNIQKDYNLSANFSRKSFNKALVSTLTTYPNNIEGQVQNGACYISYNLKALLIVNGPNFNVYYRKYSTDDFKLIQEDISHFELPLIYYEQVRYNTSNPNGSLCVRHVQGKSETKVYNSSFNFDVNKSLTSFDGGNGEYYFALHDTPSNHLNVVDKEGNALLESGNATSQSISNSLKDDKLSMDNNFNSFENTEKQYLGKFTQNINKINPNNFNISSNANFRKSADFVKIQFDKLIKNPIGDVLGFSLVVGLALLLIARRL